MLSIFSLTASPAFAGYSDEERFAAPEWAGTYFYPAVSYGGNIEFSSAEFILYCAARRKHLIDGIEPRLYIEDQEGLINYKTSYATNPVPSSLGRLVDWYLVSEGTIRASNLEPGEYNLVIETHYICGDKDWKKSEKMYKIPFLVVDPINILSDARFEADGLNDSAYPMAFTNPFTASRGKNGPSESASPAVLAAFAALGSLGTGYFIIRNGSGKIATPSLQNKYLAFVSLREKAREASRKTMDALDRLWRAYEEAKERKARKKAVKDFLKDFEKLKSLGTLEEQRDFVKALQEKYKHNEHIPENYLTSLAALSGGLKNNKNESGIASNRPEPWKEELGRTLNDIGESGQQFLKNLIIAVLIGTPAAAAAAVAYTWQPEAGPAVMVAGYAIALPILSIFYAGFTAIKLVGDFLQRSECKERGDACCVKKETRELKEGGIDLAVDIVIGKALSTAPTVVKYPAKELSKKAAKGILIGPPDEDCE